VADTGQYILAVSFVGLFAILADIGLVEVMTKEIAQEPEDVNQLYNQIFTFKLLLSLITGSLIVLATNLMSYQAQTLQLIYLAGLAIILDSFSLINWGVFRGLHNLRYKSLGILGWQTLMVTVAAATYFVLAWLVRLIKPQDMQIVKQLLPKYFYKLS